MNPWAPESKSLFDSPRENYPSVSRPWGEAPRQERRERERSTYSREGQFDYGFNAPYGQYMYPGFNAFGLPGYGYQGYPGTLGRPFWPDMGYPHWGSPYYSQPYRSFPFSMNRMGWPFSIW